MSLRSSGLRVFQVAQLNLFRHFLDRRHLALGPGFAQLELLDLARSRQRESIHDEPMLRRLVRGERGTHVVDQFFLFDCSTRRRADEGRDLFAPSLMRNADDCDFTDLSETFMSGTLTDFSMTTTRFAYQTGAGLQFTGRIAKGLVGSP